MNISRSTKIFSTQEGKISSGWHPIQSNQHEKKQENTIPNEEKNNQLKLALKKIQMLEIIDKGITIVI